MVFRSCLALAALLLFGCIWASAQENRPPGVNASTTGAPVDAAAHTLDGKEALLTFGLDRVEVLQPTLAGHPRWQYVASLLYIILAFLAAKVVDFLTRVWLKRWAERTATKFDDLLIELLHGPTKIVVFVILLHIGLNVFRWAPWFEDLLRKGLKIVVACSLTYLGIKLIDLVLGFWRERAGRGGDRAFDEMLFPIVRKALKVFVIVVAVLLTSQNLGLDITSVIASLSIGGLALGLAAQDTLANLFGAVSVFIDKPFQIGDRIQLDKVDGMVESIGLRSTRVRNLDGHLITIPNKTMGNATITNITRRPNIKTVMNFGITYDTPVAKVKKAVEILDRVYRSHPNTGDLLISFNQFADSALNILVVHWWNTTDQKAQILGMQVLNLQIKEEFDREGISFAFPSRTVYLRQDSAWQIAPPEQGQAAKAT